MWNFANNHEFLFAFICIYISYVIGTVATNGLKVIMYRIQNRNK